jgi:hypothetical protein
LIFEYDGEEVRLLQQQPVDVAVSGFDLPQEQVPGHHVEVRGANDRVLSRVPIRVAMSTSVEVFPEDPQDPITRTDLPRAQGAFTVVVPVAANAEHVAVVRIAAPTGEPGVQAVDTTELARFPLEGGGPR